MINRKPAGVCISSTDGGEVPEAERPRGRREPKREMDRDKELGTVGGRIQRSPGYRMNVDRIGYDRIG